MTAPTLPQCPDIHLARDGGDLSSPASFGKGSCAGAHLGVLLSGSSLGCSEGTVQAALGEMVEVIWGDTSELQEMSPRRVVLLTVGSRPKHILHGVLGVPIPYTSSLGSPVSP